LALNTDTIIHLDITECSQGVSGSPHRATY